MKALFLLALIFAGAAHAADALVDVSKHDLPAHRLQFSDSLDVVVDTQYGNVCYVVRPSDKSEVAVSCLPIKK